MLNFLCSLTKSLKFPNRTLETAMIYYQKYYLFNTFSTSTNLDVAITSLFIASKNEDTIKKLRDIIVAANPLRNVSNANDVVEDTKKAILGMEKKMLETLSFDFRTYHVEELLIRIAKDLKLSFDLTYLAYLIAFDSFQTEISLKVPPHATALACIIIAAKFLDVTSIFPLQSTNYHCDRNLVNEALFEILELYINNYNYSNLVNIYPSEQEKFIKIRINLKSENSLQSISEKSLKEDKFFNPKNYSISDNGSARYMLGNQYKRFSKEVENCESNKDKSFTSKKPH